MRPLLAPTILEKRSSKLRFSFVCQQFVFAIQAPNWMDCAERKNQITDFWQRVKPLPDMLWLLSPVSEGEQWFARGKSPLPWLRANPQPHPLISSLPRNKNPHCGARNLKLRSWMKIQTNRQPLPILLHVCQNAEDHHQPAPTLTTHYFPVTPLLPPHSHPSLPPPPPQPQGCKNEMCKMDSMCSMQFGIGSK